MNPATLSKIIEINREKHGQTAGDALDQISDLLRVDVAALRAAYEAGEPVIRNWSLQLAAAAIRVADHGLGAANCPAPDPDALRTATSR